MSHVLGTSHPPDGHVPEVAVALFGRDVVAASSAAHARVSPTWALFAVA